MIESEAINIAEEFLKHEPFGDQCVFLAAHRIPASEMLLPDGDFVWSVVFSIRFNEEYITTNPLVVLICERLRTARLF